MAYSYGAPLTPAESRYRQIAEAMMARGINPQVTMGGWGGLAQALGGIGQAYLGKQIGSRADLERQGAIDKAMAQINSLNLPPEVLKIVQGMTGIEPMMGLSTAAGIMSKDPSETWTPLTDEQERAAGLDTSGTYQRSNLTGKVDVVSAPKGLTSTKFTGPGNVGLEVFGYNPQPGETSLLDKSGRPVTIDQLQGGQGSIETAPLAAPSEAAPNAYEPTIQKAAAEFGVPLDLLRGVIQRESAAFDPDVISGKRLSPAGAIGIAQFMPDTASEMGIDPTDPQESIYASAKYLRQNFDKFGKSWTNALAAYNWGPGNLEKQGILKAPKETRDYISALAPLAGERGETKVAAGDGFDWSQYNTPKDRETPAGSFGGTSMEAQAWNVIIGGNTSSPEYAASYNMLFEQPKMIQTETGMVPVMMPVPPFVKRPTGGASTSMSAGQPLPGTEKPTTDTERASAGFAARMEAAEPIIQKYSADVASGWQNFLNNVPGGNYLQSDAFQQAKQAQGDWVRAKLRKESGAVIGPEEMQDEVTTYFPQPGDGQSVIDQKTQARAQALEGMRGQAGRAGQAKVKRWKIENGNLVPE